MKTKFIVGAALCLLPVVAQNANAQNADAQSSAAQPNAAFGANQPDWVTLRLNVQPGTRYRMTQDTDMKMVFVTATGKRPAEKMEMAMTGKQVLDYAFLYRNADGTMQVRTTYGASSNRSSFKQNGKTQVVPSSASDQFMAGQSVEMKMSARGEISEIRGLEKIWDKAFSSKNTPGMTPAMRSQMRANMNKMFGEKTIKSLTEQSGMSFPENPVRVGDSWMQRIETTGAMPFVINLRRTLQARDNGTLRIGEKGSLSFGDAQKAMPMAGANLKMLISGTYSGTTILDDRTNFVSQATTSQRYGGQASSSAKSQNLAMRIYGTGTSRTVVEMVQ